MTNGKTVNERQEILRAEAIIEKAKREGATDAGVVESLVTHMVSRTLIEQLTGISPEHKKKDKTDKQGSLHAWVKTRVGESLTTQEIATELGVSYPTAIKVIKDNTDFFTRVKRGLWSVRDGIAERDEAKSSK